MSRDTYDLRKKAAQFNADAQFIVDEAGRAGRELTPREIAQITSYTEKGNLAIQEADALDGLAAQDRYLNTPQPRLTGPSTSSTSTATLTVPPRGALAASDRAQAQQYVAHFARTGQRLGLADATNAMSISSLPDGGYEVPATVSTEIAVVAANSSPLYRAAKNVTGASDGYYATVATNLPAASWIAEGATRSNTASATLAQVTFSRGAIYACVSASTWLLQDSVANIYDYVTSELGRQFGASIGTALTTGSGTNSPKGLTSQTLVATADGARAFGSVQYVPTGGATQAPSIDNCIQALAALHPQYWDGAAWLMSPSAAQALLTSKASTAGSYLWQPNPASGLPMTLLGKAVMIDPTLPAATTANSYSIWLGNWQRAYCVVNYGSPIMIRDDVTSKGNVLIYSEQRVGGNVLDSSALKAIKTSVS
jgi:HK97 family phage major capsid protein